MTTVNITEFEGLVDQYAEAKDGGAEILDQIKTTLAPLCATGKVDTTSDEYGKVRDAASRVLRLAYFRKPRKGIDMTAAQEGVDADDKTAKAWDKQDPRKVGRAACFAYARRAWQDITDKCFPKSTKSTTSSKAGKAGKAGNADKVAQGETAPPMTPEVLIGAIDALMVTLSVDAGKAFLHALRNNCKAYALYLDAGKPVPKAV